MKRIVILFLVLSVMACGKRDPEYVGLLSMTSYEMFPNASGLRSLALAASDGDLKRIDILVENGVNVNAVGARGLSPGCWVLYHPNINGFKRLLEHGADPNKVLNSSFAKQQYSTSLIHLAAEKSRTIGVEYLKMVLEIGKGNPNLELTDCGDRPIGYTVLFGQEEAFALLYNAGAEIDYSDKYKALIYRAAIAENYELVLFLLHQGVDFKKKNSAGRDVRNMMSITLKFRPSIVLNDYWFWRCVDFLEKRGVQLGITPEQEKYRPKALPTTPTIYDIEIAKGK
nr:ankyrin repeat domain-containing protein [uncultured Pseudodesulfovibrio sp.]